MINDLTNDMSSNAPGGKFQADVNGIEISLSDPVPQARQILSEANFEPASDHVLITLLKHETRSLGLDETVDLRGNAPKVFMAFRSDRIFRFTLNDHGCEWGETVINEPTLRRISGAKEDEVLIVDREDEDLILEPGDQVDLSKAGTERIRSASRYIEVFLNCEPREIPRGTYTTEQLITILHVEAGYVLNLLNAQDQLVPLKPGERLHVREGMKFFSQVPCGAAS